MRLAVVLWNGKRGGAESFSAALSREFSRLGVDVRVLFVEEPEPLRGELESDGIACEALGLRRGRQVAFHPRLFARAASFRDAEAALLVASGYLAGALRLGGYRGKIVSVNHDTLLQPRPRTERLVRLVDRLGGVWASNAEVAVSDFLLKRLRRQPHARRLVRIHNGVDVAVFTPDPRPEDTPFVVGCAGRLIAGKGVDDLLRAFALLPESARLRIAGEGPELGSLRGGASALGLDGRVAFEGWVPSVPEFWRGCHVAAMPSNQWVESFGMSAAEAMATGLPVVATRNGALPELIEDGQFGFLTPPGDEQALAGAIRAYLNDPELRREHGLRARRACEERFDLKGCARSYLDLLAALRGGT